MARTTIRTEDITASEVTTAKMATDPTNASNLASGTVGSARMGSGTASSSTILYGDGTWKAEPVTDTGGLEDDIALLGFRVASNGSLAKYNLVDQTVDDFQDTSGVDASASTNEARNAAGKYYSGSSAATGGTVTTYGSYTINTFLLADTGTNLVAGGSGLADILIVAGGAEGGPQLGGGGGGAGGFKYYSQTTVSAGDNAVVVGAGGTGGGSPGNSGGNSSFASLVSTGGGGGSRGDTSSAGPGADGGSGGGGGARNSQAGGSGVANQGNSGGASTSSGDSSQDSGGGGGGASASGSSASGGTAGNGGAGYTEGATVYDWESGSGTVTFPSEFKVGSGGNLSYAGGGGGGSEPGNNGSGGTGGGAAAGANGTANTGGGGGGYGGGATAQGTGGSGIVVIRSLTGALDAAGDMTLVSTTTAAQAAPTKGDIVLTYTNGSGTTTLDTDLTAEISADGGSTWTALALGSEGSTGSHNIATSHDVTISSTITAPYNMAYRIKTLNQSGSKETRIQAVSLGWS